MPTFFRTLVLALVATAFGASTATAQGGPPGGNTKTFTIVSVVYMAGELEATAPFNGNGIAQIPPTAVTDVIKIKGTYTPGGANVTASISVRKITTDPPAALEYATSNTNGNWEISIPANTLSAATNYTIKAVGNIATIDGTNVAVTGKQLSIINQ